MTSVTDPIEALETRDVGLQALCGIAAYYRIIATPVHVRRELALRDQEVGPADLVRAAQLIGLRARIIFPLEKNRLAALPAPTILRMRSGGYEVYGGRIPSGEYRLVNPLTRADRALSLDNLFEQAAEAVLVSRKLGGVGIDPQTFSLKWFLPSIWRYRRPLAHVLLASFFVQIFALVTPLFFQVVIDKVLSHQELSTRCSCWSAGLRSSACSMSRCNICEPTRCRTRRTALMSNLAGGCFSIFCVCR